MSHQLPDAQNKRLLPDKQTSASWDAATEVKKLEAVDHLLSRALYRSLCPSSEMLSNFEEETLPSSELESVAVHLKTCKYCSAELADLQTHLAAFPEPEPIQPPSVWTQVTQYIAQEISTLPLLMGKPSRNTTIAKRSAQQDPKQYIYVVSVESSVPIMLDIEADPQHIGRFQLICQSSFESAETLQATLWRNGNATPVATGMVSELGESRFDNLVTGHYELILSNEQIEIYLRDIQI
ncbi:MAG: hypothetical protein ACPG8W_11695 [Candidatus Promineifilaceae bacterium]